MNFNLPKQDSSEDLILNTGLALAMAFGTDWLKPINKRLIEKYSFLSPYESERYNSICQMAMSAGHKYIYARLDKLAILESTITATALKDELATHLKSKFNWINDTNLDKLYSQGCYYAYKDGLHNVISD